MGGGRADRGRGRVRMSWCCGTYIEINKNPLLFWPFVVADRLKRLFSSPYNNYIGITINGKSRNKSHGPDENGEPSHIERCPACITQERSRLFPQSCRGARRRPFGKTPSDSRPWAPKK